MFTSIWTFLGSGPSRQQVEPEERMKLELARRTPDVVWARLQNKSGWFL